MKPRSRNFVVEIKRRGKKSVTSVKTLGQPDTPASREADKVFGSAGRFATASTAFKANSGTAFDNKQAESDHSRQDPVETINDPKKQDRGRLRHPGKRSQR